MIEPVSPQRLLAGTELETAPERRGRPVPVIKAGMAAPTPVQPSAGAVVAAPQSAPKPVAVVKPQKRATIGDMLRASQEGGSAGDGVYEPPYNGGGYAAVPTRPVPAQQQPASYPAPAPAGAYPVQTGSRAAAAAAAAAEQAADPASSAVVPVQYNSDGSVVLAAKPIKVGSVCRAMYGADGLGWWIGWVPHKPRPSTSCFGEFARPPAGSRFLSATLCHSPSASHFASRPGPHPPRSW